MIFNFIIAFIIYFLLDLIISLLIPNSVIASIVMSTIIAFVYAILYMPDKKGFYKNPTFYKIFFSMGIIFLLIDWVMFVLL